MEPDDFLCSRNALPQKGGIGSHQTILLARRAPTVKQWSLDARSEGQSGDSLGREGVMMQRRKRKIFAGRAQWKINQPSIHEFGNERAGSLMGKVVA